MAEHVRLRQIVRLLLAIAVTIAAGTVAFHESIDESWFQSFYRSVVTVSLTGLDSVPASDGARVVSIVLVVVGITIIAYAGAVIVEAVAGGVCHGRAGGTTEGAGDPAAERPLHHLRLRPRRPASRGGIRAAGVPFLVLDFHEDAVEAARDDGVLLLEGDATRDENLRGRAWSARGGSWLLPTRTSTTSSSSSRPARRAPI